MFNKMVTILTKKMVLIFLLFSASACSSNNWNLEPTITPFPTSVRQVRQTYTVERGEVINQVDISGRIVPVEQYDLFFKIDGRIRNLYNRKADIVKEGQVLADMEGVDTIQRNLALREMGLERARINAENASLSLELFKKTNSPFSRGYAEMLSMKENEVALANLAVAETELIIGETQLAITDTLLLAPQNGTIISLYLKEGGEVYSYQSVGTVADLAFLEVGLQSLPDSLSRIEIGSEALITPRRGNGESLTGMVRWISSGLPNEGMGNDSVRISLPIPANQAGYELDDLVEVSIILEYKENTLWLPPSAIRKFEGRTFVVVQDGDLQRRTDVRLGVIGQDRIEILSGLSEGQIVVGQ